MTTWGSLSTLVFLVGLAVTQLGCAGVTVTYPYCPVPVLISRVDRIGGTAGQETPATPIGVTQGFVAQEMLAGGGSGSSSSSSVAIDPGMLTGNLLSALPTGREVEGVDVRLDSVDVWGYVSYHLFLLASGAHGRTTGTVVRPQ